MRVKIVRQESTTKRFIIGITRWDIREGKSGTILRDDFHLADLIRIRKAIDQALEQHRNKEMIYVEV